MCAATSTQYIGLPTGRWALGRLAEFRVKPPEVYFLLAAPWFIGWWGLRRVYDSVRFRPRVSASYAVHFLSWESKP